MLEFSIITISVFVRILVSTTRYISTDCFKKDISNILPILSIIYGIGLAIAGYYLPDVDMGDNIVEAIFLGIATGAAAVGYHQVGKQMDKRLESKQTIQQILDIPSPIAIDELNRDDINIDIDLTNIVDE